MTFEDQLTRAFDTLSERLRGEIEQEVQRRTADAIASAPVPDTQPAETIAPPVETIAPAAYAAHLNDAVGSMERARSLSDVLDALVSGARAQAARADVWLLRGGRLHQWRPAGAEGAGSEPAPAVAEAARTNALVAHDGAIAVPIAIAGAVVAVLFADGGEPGALNDEPPTVNVELLARFAARSLEALTAFKTARALIGRPEADGADGPTVPGDDASGEEDTSARRYARLLVSEIKLYHEEAVVEGRRDRDLTARLGGEIARARVMYEQRVPPHVRARGDYFQDELVRTLANGDASLFHVRSQKLEVGS